jgi:L-fucose isomerase-like protein
MRGWRIPGSLRLCYTILSAPGSQGYASLVERLLRRDLGALGVRVSGVPPEDPGGCDGLLALAATGGVEEYILDLARRFRPLIVAGHPTANSSASIAEVSRDLEGLGSPPVLLGPLGLGHPSTLERLSQALRALAAAALMRGARVGVVGDPPGWIVHDARGLASALGVEAVRVRVEELLEEIPDGPPSPPPWLIERALYVEAEPGALRDALRVYEALKRLSRRLDLDAIAPSCPSFMEATGSNACLGGAILNMEGVTVGCEGDLAATITLHLAQLAAQRPGFLANTAWLEGRRILLAHCSAPLSMGLAHAVRRHFITGRSPTLSVWIPQGLRVTLAQASQDGLRLHLAEGVVVDGSPWRGRQCETQALVELETEPEGEARLGSGNHVAMTTGLWSRALRWAWRILNLQAP